MKILVCMSNVPDTTTKIKLNGDGTDYDKTGIQWIVNPWDELALTRALQLKDAGAVEKVTVINVGLTDTDPTIRKALAMGADDAIRVNADPKEAYFVAAQLAEAIRNNMYDVILAGIDSADYNGSLVGGMLAEFLDLPSVSSVSELFIEGGKVKLHREIDGGSEIIEVETPFVGIVQKGIAKEPVIASMRGIMMSRTKPIVVVEPAAIEAQTEFLSYELPKPKAACRMVDPENPKELVDLLYNEAKILS